MAGLNLPIAEPALTIEVEADPVQVEVHEHGQKATSSKRAWLRSAGLLLTLAGLLLIGVSVLVVLPSPSHTESTSSSAALASQPDLEAWAPVHLPATRTGGPRQINKGIQAYLVAPGKTPQVMESLRRTPVMQPWTAPAMQPVTFNSPAVDSHGNAHRSQSMTAGVARNWISNRMQPGESTASGRSGFFGNTFMMLSMLGVSTGAAFAVMKGVHMSLEHQNFGRSKIRATNVGLNQMKGMQEVDGGDGNVVVEFNPYDPETGYWLGEWICADCGFIYGSRGETQAFETLGRWYKCPQCAGPRRRFAKKLGGKVGGAAGDGAIIASTGIGLLLILGIFVYGISQSAF